MNLRETHMCNRPFSWLAVMLQPKCGAARKWNKTAKNGVCKSIRDYKLTEMPASGVRVSRRTKEIKCVSERVDVWGRDGECVWLFIENLVSGHIIRCKIECLPLFDGMKCQLLPFPYELLISPTHTPLQLCNETDHKVIDVYYCMKWTDFISIRLRSLQHNNHSNIKIISNYNIYAAVSESQCCAKRHNRWSACAQSPCRWHLSPTQRKLTHNLSHSLIYGWFLWCYTTTIIDNQR